MIFKDGIQYDLDNDFMKKDLGAITPAVIVRWMCLKVYGNPGPNLNDILTQVRSSSITYAKKAISYFMPNRPMLWNELENPPVGNSTKSIPINDLIKKMKNKEAWKQGKPSQAWKPFTEQDYEAATPKMDRHENVEIRLFCVINFRLQMTMLARIDDSSKLLSENLK